MPAKRDYFEQALKEAEDRINELEEECSVLARGNTDLHRQLAEMKETMVQRVMGFQRKVREVASL